MPKKQKLPLPNYDMLIYDPDEDKTITLSKVKRHKGAKLGKDWTVIQFFEGAKWFGTSEIHNSALVPKKIYSAKGHIPLIMISFVGKPAN